MQISNFYSYLTSNIHVAHRPVVQRNLGTVWVHPYFKIVFGAISLHVQIVFYHDLIIRYFQV